MHGDDMDAAIAAQLEEEEKLCQKPAEQQSPWHP